MKLFVPGRLCLFGEHSDWAGEYRLQNPYLLPGIALVVGTNQGIYGEIKPHPQQLIVRIPADLEVTQKMLQLPMKQDVLEAEASRGGWFSYVAGVACKALTKYQVGGLEIDNYLIDLPIKKGLSSSAAICVLVARAFNQLYNLNLTVQEEMELAYRGERSTPSQCGRMDQACAYGHQPILMTFDGSLVTVKSISVGCDLYLVIVDLAGSKNTQLILQQLNQCYPIARNTIQENVQQYLSQINTQITQAAAIALEQGDSAELGNLMIQAQKAFDRYVMPACPSQLTAPILHQLLNEQSIQPYIFGGKGVGSQGDGTAQFIAKDYQTQQQLIELITNKFPSMKCLPLTLKAS
ncbi:GHMP kinase [Stanieria cyanosphaera PCC 7437]|uniref:GHMP kinase n=1 Tax=Stanieria cyanosphaera (strain ATCC 29371 / PCC 7437) TaxID=111780 RepID=K9XZQ4_STAC7|nr:GHMP kinase [Stanieria cyanosphaera]AFZ37152.1 GHMP kinase [Stanieria cyanosphaera PCC 7437]